MMPRIVVAGSINMDLVVRSPRFAMPGETILGDLFFTVPGGKGANQAVAARRLGAEVAIVGRLGKDAFGDTMRHNLSSEGINTRHLTTDEDESSGVALITVDKSGENTIIVVPGANGRVTGDDVEAARALIAGADILLIQLEIPLSTVEYAAQVAGASGVTVVLNAAPAPARALPETLLALADYLVLNETEALILADMGSDSAGSSPEVPARRLQERGGRNVVITLGALGSLLVASDGAAVSASAFKVHTVDTTAAGDGFVGALAVALAEGAGPQAALRWGNAAGALAVTRSGAQPSLPTRRDVEEFLRARQATEEESHK